MDTGSFILSMKTTNLFKDWEYFKDYIDFSELDNNPVTRILVALPRSWKNMETHGRLTKTHGKT